MLKNVLLVQGVFCMLLNEEMAANEHWSSFKARKNKIES